MRSWFFKKIEKYNRQFTKEKIQVAIEHMKNTRHKSNFKMKNLKTHCKSLSIRMAKKKEWYLLLTKDVGKYISHTFLVEI